jgi:hypothetical protein
LTIRLSRRSCLSIWGSICASRSNRWPSIRRIVE